MEIQNNIKVLRASHDMTQSELGACVSATRQTILAIEKNKYSPSLRLAFRIAEAFGVPIEDVFYLSEESDEK